jgi:peptide chain release factor
MMIHISSGNGVDEVCRAIWHFKKWLEKNYEFKLIDEQLGSCKRCIKSLLIESDDKRFLELHGTHQWRAKSPFRPKHKRKNWYFTLKCYASNNIHKIDDKEVLYQTMRSPKKGGQHVNTTSSGVRAIYKPLGVEAISFDHRSQHRNKQVALFRLIEKLESITMEKESEETQKRWREGKDVQRGGAILVFEGEGFKI